MSFTPDQTIPNLGSTLPSVAASRSRVRRNLRYRSLFLLGYVALVLFATMFLLPFIYMVSIALRPDMELLTFPIAIIPERPALGAFVDLFDGTAMTRWLINSFFVTI